MSFPLNWMQFLFTAKAPNYGEYCSLKGKVIEFGSVPILYGLYPAY